MKKLLILLMLAVLAVAIVACGSDPTPTPAPEATEAPAEATVEQPADVAPPTETPVPVAVEAPTEAPAAVELTGAPASAESIVGIKWLWSDLVEAAPAAQSVVPNPESYVVVFLPDGSVSITADCNSVVGTYAVQGDAINISLGPSTMAFCGEESLDQQFLALLSEANRGSLDGDRLYLYTPDNAARMGFTNGGPASDLAAEVGIAPNQVSLDTQGLPYSWQAVLVPESPYDQSQPPGPKGLPAHMQILFGVSDPAQRTQGDPTSPIMYIIPADAYQQMWDSAGNDSVTRAMNSVWDMTAAIPYPPQTSGMPVLPYEEVGGANDLAVQLGRTTPTEQSASKNGYRFVGRWAQDANPVTNQGLRYVYQGFTNDGKYLVSFWYPVSTGALPVDMSAVSQETMDRFNADYQAHIDEQAALLNGLSTADWMPDLATLDALVASLEIATTPSSGLPGNVWQYIARNFDGQAEVPVDIAQTNVIVFNLDGTVTYVADCNQGSGSYDLTGGLIGSLAIQLGPSTLSECGPESLGQELVDTLTAAQDYRIRPGGHLLEVVRPAGGGYLLFNNLGPAGSGGPEVEIPEPPADGIIGTVIAPAGVNVRTGPGTAYAILGIAGYGRQGEIAGQSADGQWYMTPLADSPTGQGWVNTSFVVISGGEEIPVVPAPPPPATAVPTATPLPTATPPPSVVFTADRTVIQQGECATLSWNVENVQAVWIYPLGLPFSQFPVTGQGNQQVCPSTTTTYEMRVQRTDGAIELYQITITVIVSNPLANSGWLVSSINVNQVPVPGTTMTLAFTADQAAANGGCNSSSGPYVVSGSSITIGPLVGTQISCGAEVDQQESVYIGLLQSATAYQLVGSQLVLFDGAGNEIIRLNRTG